MQVSKGNDLLDKPITESFEDLMFRLDKHNVINLKSILQKSLQLEFYSFYS